MLWNRNRRCLEVQASTLPLWPAHSPQSSLRFKLGQLPVVIRMAQFRQSTPVLSRPAVLVEARRGPFLALHEIEV